MQSQEERLRSAAVARVDVSNEHPLVQAIYRRAERDALYMVASGPKLLTPTDPRRPVGFSTAMRGGLCYKVFVQAESEQAEIEVRVTDDQGMLVQRHRGAGEAAIGVVRAICPETAGLYRVDIQSSVATMVAAQTFVSQ